MLDALSILFSCSLLLYICWRFARLTRKGESK
jgi:hypothetical protein